MGLRIIRIISKLEGWVIFFAIFASLCFSGLVKSNPKWLFFIALSLPFVFIFGWLLAIGVSLNEKVPAEDNEDLTLFKWASGYGILFAPISQLVMYMLEPDWHIVLIPFLVLF